MKNDSVISKFNGNGIQKKNKYTKINSNNDQSFFPPYFYDVSIFMMCVCVCIRSLANDTFR